MKENQKALHMNAAVRACLTECYNSSQPLDCLAAFIDSLRRHGHWRDAELLQIEMTVRRILNSVVTPVGDELVEK
jgi:hypothetical protein